jgi:2-iminobutanoate/2-iminopropanoate deaminase
MPSSQVIKCISKDPSIALTSIMKGLVFLLFCIVQVQSFSSIKPAASLTSSNLKMSTEIKEVQTNDAPAPVGPYSQAVLAGSTLYCSGSIALDPATGDFLGGGDVQEEAKQCLKNMDAILKAGGASAKNVVRCTVFLADLADFSKVNEVYAEYFKDNAVAPSRSCVQAAALPKGALVEIDCIAVL